MQTYTHYKDSGIVWIGQIPEYWEVKKVKEICSMNGRIGFRGYSQSDLVSEGEGAITISPSNIVENQMHFDNNTYLSWEKYFESPEIMVSNDDILIVKTGSTVGKVGIVKNLNIEATINPQLLVIKNIKTNIQFTYEYLHSNIFYDFVKSNAIGSTIPTISETKIGNLPIIYPPIEEQEAIANFLDDKTAKIDALVQTKEQQIEKLKELRQAKIHQAVTKGLDANAPTKNSGVEWIGEIPAHWRVKKVKHLAYIKSGEAIINSQLKDIGKYEVFGGNGLMGYYDKYNVNGKNLIIGRVGALCGNVRYIEDKKWISDNALILKLINEKYYRFIDIALRAGDLNKLNTSNAQPLITGTKVLNFSISFPPIQEQEQIVAYLDEVTGKIDQAIAQKQEQITKLKAYRQSLINDVVTGKVKVC